MTAFVLKPQQQLTHWNLSAKHILWTEDRQTVPESLQGRITIDTWQDTVDAVEKLYQTRFNAVNFATRLPVVHIVAFPYNLYSRSAYEGRWRELVKELADLYRRAGFKVTLVQDFNHRRAITVGLKFEELDVGPTEPSIWY